MPWSLSTYKPGHSLGQKRNLIFEMKIPMLIKGGMHCDNSEKDNLLEIKIPRKMLKKLLEKENQHSFFRFSFRATFIFPL